MLVLRYHYITWLSTFISIQECLNVWHILIATARLGSRSLQGTLEGNDISSGYDCTQRFNPQALPFIFICVSLQWLYPQRRQTAAVWRRRCRRGTANLPQGHRNSSSLKWVSTPNRTFITSPRDGTGAVAGHTQIHTHIHTGWYWWFNAVLFQELECAVSVEEDNRQEWTFTLYDFDNNGKVTREVIICSEPLMYSMSKQANEYNTPYKYIRQHYLDRFIWNFCSYFASSLCYRAQKVSNSSFLIWSKLVFILSVFRFFLLQ